MSQENNENIEVIFSELEPKDYSESEIEVFVKKVGDYTEGFGGRIRDSHTRYKILSKLLEKAWNKYKNEGLELTDNGIRRIFEVLCGQRLNSTWDPNETSQLHVLNLINEILDAREKLNLSDRAIEVMFNELTSVLANFPEKIDISAIWHLINEIWNNRTKLILSKSTICTMFQGFSRLISQKPKTLKEQKKIDQQAFFNLINEIWNEQAEDVGVSVLAQYTFKALAHVIDAGHGEIDEQPVLELINKILDKYERAKVRYKELEEKFNTNKDKYFDQYLKATWAIELNDQDIRQMFKALAKAIDKGQGKINKQSIVTLIARVLNMPRDIDECQKLYLSSKTIKYMFGALICVINKGKGEIDKQTILKLLDKAWAKELYRDDPSKFMLMALTYAVGKNSEQVEKQIGEPSILEMVDAVWENPQKLQLSSNIVSFMLAELINRMVTGTEKISEQTVFKLLNKILDSCKESQLTDSATKWMFVSFAFISAIKQETTENILSLIGCTRDILKYTAGLNDDALAKIFDVLKNKLGKEAIGEISIMISQMQNANESAKNKFQSLLLELEKKEVKKEKDEKREKYNTKGDIALGFTVGSVGFFDNDHELSELFNKKLKEPSVSILEIVDLFLDNHERLQRINKDHIIESLFSVLMYQMVNGKEKIDEQAMENVLNLVDDTMNISTDLELEFETIQWMFTALAFAIAIQKETRENVMLLAGSVGDILESGKERCIGFDIEHLDETLNALIYMSENETVKKISNIILKMQDTKQSVKSTYSKISIELGRENWMEEEIIEGKPEKESFKLQISPTRENEKITEKKLNLDGDKNEKKQDNWHVEKNAKDTKERLENFQDQQSQSTSQKTGIIDTVFNSIWWAVTKFCSMIKNAFLAILNWLKSKSNKKPEFVSDEIKNETLDNNFDQAKKLSKAQKQDKTRHNEANNLDK